MSPAPWGPRAQSRWEVADGECWAQVRLRTAAEVMVFPGGAQPHPSNRERKGDASLWEEALTALILGKDTEHRGLH